ncbi:AMP-binding protein [Amycolatopsis sp. NPDC051903]|uniref:AMP-binding protein n=1 Tax=Amycolatopsis sp. NPDC051903 TaxID=3363936 RepID=UPI003787DE35
MTLPSVPATVPAALDAAAHHPGLAVADGPVRLTWPELHARVRSFAAFVHTRGLGPGSRIAVCSPNTWHWVVAGLGILYAGATLVPISTRFTAREIHDVLTRSHASGLVICGRFLGTSRLSGLTALPPLVVRVPVEEVAEPAVAGVTEWSDVDGCGDSALPVASAATPARAAGSTLRAAELAAPARAPDPPSTSGDRSEPRATGSIRSPGPDPGLVRPDDVSDILFTSGTTGRSKGAMSAHRQALGVAAAWAECSELSTRDRYLVVNPFFHSFGYKAGILACVLTGATIVPQRVFDVSATLRLIQDERITVLPGAPTVYRMLLDAPDRSRWDLSSLRLAVTGAATVPVSLVSQMEAELGFETVLTAYGLTEAVVATMSRPSDPPDVVAQYAGRATAGFEVRLGTDDEVLLRGPNVMLGYLDDPGATAAAIDADGWLHTGDVGRLSPDGHLKITDRLKDVYVCGGFNVYPAEVEQVLAEHPDVAESAVIGVPDARLGEVGRAFVVPRPGSRPSADEILAHCKENLANFKLPRSVELVAELPRSPAGKVLKRLLREDTHG